MKLTKKEQLEFVPFTPDMIKDILGKNDDQLKKSLLALFEYQTNQEQNALITIEDNGVGFSGSDGEILSSFANQLTKKNFLTEKQLVILRKKMPKYSKQLARIANKKYAMKVKA